jgi:iron complex transport system ATP-binding protein
MQLTATDIHVKLGRKEILHGVDFTAQAGDVTAIVGPNGSGKTTLLRAITGELAYTGQVQINGKNCAAMKPHELAMTRAVLPQAANLAFPFTVLEVVRLGLTAGLASTQPDNTDALPLQALARVGLTGFEGRYFHDLSGGEKQRVQLARVLVQIWEPVRDGQPRWLFLDEPVSALDIGHQLVVMQLAQDYARAGGGVIAVMHDLNLTAMFADQVTLIDAGEICATGTPAQVMTNDTLSRAYHCALQVNTAPPQGGAWILPQAATVQ